MISFPPQYDEAGLEPPQSGLPAVGSDDGAPQPASACAPTSAGVRSEGIADVVDVVHIHGDGAGGPDEEGGPFVAPERPLRHGDEQSTSAATRRPEAHCNHNMNR